MSTNHNFRWLSYNQWSVYKPGKFAAEKSWLYFFTMLSANQVHSMFWGRYLFFKVKHLHVFFSHSKYIRVHIGAFLYYFILGAVFLVVHLYASVPVGHLFVLYKFLTQVLQTSSRHWWDVELPETAYRYDYRWNIWGGSLGAIQLQRWGMLMINLWKLIM